MFVAGVDGCRGGWVAFNVDTDSLSTSVELIDLPSTLWNKAPGLAFLAIDIPIGLLDVSRACDKAARKLLGQPRGTSVFAAPCRAAVQASSYAEANASNQNRTGRGLNVFTWGIAPKIKQVDDAITPECQRWAVEVHPEICFWALAGGRPMTHRKKIPAGVNERLDLLRPLFPDIDQHLQHRPSGVAKDDLLDAAAAAWTALRLHAQEAKRVSKPERDDRGLAATIWY